MKTKKQTTAKRKEIKTFQPLDNKKLEAIIGGPITSRGTVTTVLDSNG